MDAMPRLPSLLGALILAWLAAWSAYWPASAAGPTPLCIYDGNSFSEGAHVCAQGSLVLTCSVAGDRAVWKVVTDREISRLCVTPSREAVGPRWRRQVIRRAPPSVAPPEDTAAPSVGGPGKCFTFNGKRYCE